MKPTDAQMAMAPMVEANRQGFNVNESLVLGYLYQHPEGGSPNAIYLATGAGGFRQAIATLETKGCAKREAHPQATQKDRTIVYITCGGHEAFSQIIRHMAVVCRGGEG